VNIALALRTSQNVQQFLTDSHNDSLLTLFPWGID
jgi:hypothetical protein